jgi:hypothetical protein
MSFMAFYTRGIDDPVYYFFSILPALAGILFIGLFLVELYWLMSRRPVAEVTNEGIWIYRWNKREFHRWEGVKKYRFKMNKFARGAGLVEFYDKPGNRLFDLDTSRATWHRTKLKENLSYYAKCINNNNQPWT